MLLLSSHGNPWATGSAPFYFLHEEGIHTIIVGVECRLGSSEVREVALLDTAAQWSIIGGEVANSIAGDLEDAGVELRFSTRLGDLDATLHRLHVCFVAEEGKDLWVDATVAVVEDWTGPIVIGYEGLLERMRMAIDPGIENEGQRFAFGSTA